MDRAALVTGGASPIGAAICVRLAADGVRVLVHANQSRDAAARVAGAIVAAGGRAETLCCDLTDTAATARALAPWADAPPQILVHNAGTHHDAPLAGMTEAQWRGPIDTSLHGFFALTRPLLLPILATRWGRIVAITSVSAQLGNRGQANYAAAKAGLVGAMRSLSREVASRGITVNAVAPGIIDTPATAAIPHDQLALAVPMRRAGKPSEIADAVGFLVSDRASYITGQVLSVNGGMA